jgi:hypothetical protein
MVCVSESDIALKRVPAPSAVRFGAGCKQSISGTRRKSAGFLVESSSVSREPSRNQGARRRRHGSRRPVCHGALSSPDAPPPPRVDHDARGIAFNRRNIHGR